MQVVIPMAGFGERFRRAGHDRPKPLIEVDGRPMIAHVVDLFPGVDDPVFLVNADHLAEPAWRMEATLRALRPRGRIVPVPSHRLGPVHTLLHGLDVLDLDAPVIVSVCDLNFPWDFNHFRGWITQSGADGCVVAYRGFHPHLLHSVHYAFCRTVGDRVAEIREKYAFTDDPIGNLEYCSNGVYWWRTGRMLVEALTVVHGDVALAIAGEHYPSQLFQPMVEAGLDVVVYPVKHYLQWGNPRDLEEYRHHAAAFAARVRPWPRAAALPGTLLVPMAGLGQRFADAGYTTPKPLVPVNGGPMAVAAARDLPRCARQVFVVRDDMDGVDAVVDALDAAFPGCGVVHLAGPTDGQARTVALGIADGDVDLDAPLVIGTCDNGLRYDDAAHTAALSQADVLVWAMRGHPGAVQHPRMYGWIDADAAGRVRRMSVKVPLDDPAHDPAVVGVFSFRRAADYLAAFQRLAARDGRVRGELYVDTLIDDCLALGLDVAVFEVDHYYGWGTPDDVRTYAYWQACLHTWPDHPYRLEADGDVDPEALPALAAAAAPLVPPPAWPRGAGPTPGSE